MDAIMQAISECHSVFQADKLITKLSGDGRVELPTSLVMLQESHDPEIRQYGMVQSLKLTEEQISNDFSSLLEMKSSIHQSARDLVGHLLSCLSQENLTKHFPALISHLRSKYRFVSDEAERLLNNIEAIRLFSEFDVLHCLQNDSYQDVRRVTSELIIKIMLAWPIETKVAHCDEIFKLSHSNVISFREIGVLLSLQVMNSWEITEKAKQLNFFIGHTNAADTKTSELAASLAFEVLSQADETTRIQKIKYLTSFHYFGDIELRRKFRRLALDTISTSLLAEKHQHFDFLMQCQEAKDLEVRKTSWNLLNSISASDLVVENLANWQISGNKNIRHVSKKLALKITPASLHKKLDYFIDCQRLSDPDLRAFTSELAFRIDQKYLFRRIDYLRFRLDDKSANVIYLVQDLIDKAEKNATAIDRFFHWLYWQFQFPKA